MNVQFSGTTWNSFSHRKRKVPRLACQSSFSPQNRGQLYLSIPWESAWSKDANLRFQSAARWRSSCHGFAALCRVVSEADNCACSNAPGHLKSERPRPRQGALLKKHGGNLKESPPLMEPGSLCVCVWGGGWWGEEGKETGSNPGLSLPCAGLQLNNPPRSFICIM